MEVFSIGHSSLPLFLPKEVESLQVKAERRLEIPSIKGKRKGVESPSASVQSYFYQDSIIPNLKDYDSDSTHMHCYPSSLLFRPPITLYRESGTGHPKSGTRLDSREIFGPRV